MTGDEDTSDQGVDGPPDRVSDRSSGLPADHPLGGPDVAPRLAAALAAQDRDDDPRRRLLRAYADATRRTIDQVLTTTAPDEAIAEAVALLERATDLLAGQPHGRPYEGVAESSMAAAVPGPGDDSEGTAGGPPRAFVDYSPLIGPINPLAPPLRIELVGSKVLGRGSFGAAYEGPPGCVHGGYLAAGFDEVLGFTQSLTGQPGMTGHLQVRYRRPTPLFDELCFTAWVERIDGRKITTRATVHAGEVLTAEAEGLFISIKPEVFAQLMANRPRRG